MAETTKDPMEGVELCDTCQLPYEECTCEPLCDVCGDTLHNCLCDQENEDICEECGNILDDCTCNEESAENEEDIE